jgi:hypothetical protein
MVAPAAGIACHPHVVRTLSELTFRTLFWNSEAILPEFLKRGETGLSTEDFTHSNHLFL